jgi:hypothetical protein
LLAITADQFYSIGSQHNDVSKFEIAAKLFPIQRDIALGPSYYYLILNKPTEQSLAYINRGILYDPNAVDLIKAEIQHSFALGKKDEAVRAFIRLSIIAPNLVINKKAN